ncbi:hypothetical protein [Elstera sp.]|jgi:hypothetical protein|uniref:hypothetical protein n=1 Tax=Elstera sp. TaxID=1916664 RepID=UPI0037BF9697
MRSDDPQLPALAAALPSRAVFHWQPSAIDALTVDDFLLAHGEAEERVGLMRGGR